MRVFLALFPTISILQRNYAFPVQRERFMIYNWGNVPIARHRTLFLMDKNVWVVEQVSIIIQHQKDVWNVKAIRIMTKNSSSVLAEISILFGMANSVLLATFLSTLTLILSNVKIVLKDSISIQVSGFVNPIDLAYSWLLIYF